MPRISIRAIWQLLALSFCASVSAQRTWVVDRAGNGDFTDLPPALSAAAHGDRIRVRQGTYSPASTSKGVRILGDTGAEIRSGAFRISQIPANETFALAGFRSSAQSSWTVEVDRCAGPVILESLRTRNRPVPLFGTVDGPLSLEVRDSHAVFVTDCWMWPLSGPSALVSGADTSVTFTDCVAVGSNGTGLRGDGGAGLLLQGGFVFLSDSLFFGGGGSGVRSRGGHGVEARASEALHIGPRSALGGGLGGNPFFGGGNGGPLALYSASGPTRIDPSNSNLARYGNVPNVRIATVPSLRMNALSPGGTLAPRCSTPSNASSALAVGLAGRPLPSPWGPLFIDPATVSTLYLGPFVAQPATLSLTSTLPVGTCVVVQGLVALPGELITTNPIVRALR